MFAQRLAEFGVQKYQCFWNPYGYFFAIGLIILNKYNIIDPKIADSDAKRRFLFLRFV